MQSSVVVWHFTNNSLQHGTKLVAQGHERGPHAARTVLLVCGGNAMTLDTAWRSVCDVASANAAVDLVMWDYPGCGRSGGSADTGAMIEAAHAVKAHVLALGYRPDQVVVWGHSMGGGAAAAMSESSAAGPLGQRGLILTSTFGRLSRVVNAHTFPSLFALTGLCDLAPEAHLAKTTCPIVLAHSREDAVIPFSEMQHNERAVGPEGPTGHLQTHELKGGHDGVESFKLVQHYIRLWEA